MKEKIFLNSENPLPQWLFDNVKNSPIDKAWFEAFLSDIWFTKDEITTYKKLQRIDIFNIPEKEIDIFYDKIIFIFSHNLQAVKYDISQTDVFSSLKEKLKNKINQSDDHLSLILTTYMKDILLYLIINYEMKRISRWIFHIIENK